MQLLCILIKIACSSEMYSLTQFQDCRFTGASVAYTSQACAPTILLLLLLPI
jgi:hypothetical protein